MSQDNQPEPSPLAAVSSPDHNAERLAALKKLFPDLFSNEGRLNVDELKKVADPALVSETERYDFRWYGKTKSKREAFTPSRAALVYDAARSVNPNKAGGNLVIEAENLEALKLLTSAYRERVKLIYVDPPYNTGKDFVYSDDYSEDRKPYWEQTGVTEAGVKVDTTTESDGRFHSKWLSMMHSRLLGARYLLTRDGFIVVSIDDAEFFNLSRLMDEVFGEENFIATLVWDKNRKNDAKFFSVGHEYMLVYARDRLLLQEMGLILRADKEGVDEVKEVFDKLRAEHKDDWEKVRQGLLDHYATWPDDGLGVGGQLTKSFTPTERSHASFLQVAGGIRHLRGFGKSTRKAASSSARTKPRFRAFARISSIARHRHCGVSCSVTPRQQRRSSKRFLTARRSSTTQSTTTTSASWSNISPRKAISSWISSPVQARRVTQSWWRTAAGSSSSCNSPRPFLTRMQLGAGRWRWA
jgi:16S rRNA G966 N2-methylase RsmD